MNSDSILPKWMMVNNRGKKREVTLHVPFKEPAKGSEFFSSYFEFIDLYQTIQSRILDYRKWKHGLRVKKLRTEIKVMGIVAEAIGKDAAAVEEAARKVARMGLSKEDRESISRRMKDAIDGKADSAGSAEKVGLEAGQPTLTKRQIKAQERDLNFRSITEKGCTALFERAKAGDANAGETLAAVSLHSATLLTFLAQSCPESLKGARKQALWPVIASLNPSWDVEAKRLLRKLGVGQETFLSGLNLSIAYDDAPARRWARAAYETIELNRDRVRVLDFVRKGCQAFIPETRFVFREVPEWVLQAGDLPPFAKGTAKAWAAVAKLMIRTDCPDFHDRPEWQSFRRHHSNLDRHGNVSKGRLQNDILEKISSALTTLAQKQPPVSGNPAKDRATGHAA